MKTTHRKKAAGTRRTARELDQSVAAEAEQPSTHNNPPEPIIAAAPVPSLELTPEQWTAHMAHVFEGLEKRTIDLIESFQRFDVGYPLTAPALTGAKPAGIEKWNDEIQGRAGDLREKLQAIVKLAENLHALEKEPILRAGRAVDGYKNTFLARLVERDSKGRLITTSKAPINVVMRRQTIYAQHREAESRAAAEAGALRLKAEANAKAAEASRTMDPEQLEQTGEAYALAGQAQEFAQAKPAEHSRVHGPEGSTSSLRSNWQFIKDESDLLELAKAVVKGEAPITYLQFNETRIGIAIRSEKVREIPGCVIRNDTRM